MKRRDFINWVGLGCLASSLPVAIAACSPETSTSANAATKGWQKVGTVAQLDKTGQLLVENSTIGAVLVVGTSKAAKNLIAVNPTCTHEGCTIVMPPVSPRPCRQLNAAVSWIGCIRALNQHIVCIAFPALT